MGVNGAGQIFEWQKATPQRWPFVVSRNIAVLLALPRPTVATDAEHAA